MDEDSKKSGYIAAGILKSNYILKDKKPIRASSVLEWGKFMGDREASRVARTDITKDINVSTVFLGIDHNFTRNGPPILFETMIFGGKLNQYQERYCTWKEAEKGHEVAVKLAKKEL